MYFYRPIVKLQNILSDVISAWPSLSVYGSRNQDSVPLRVLTALYVLELPDQNK